MAFDLKILGIAGAMARHAAVRHSVIAENVANANTPGYRAKDVEPFSEAYARSIASRAKEAPSIKEIRTLGIASPNGNTVSIEDQMMRASQATRSHDLASTIYSKSLAMLRAAMGRAK
jgi:flagellar basal-body rod protein FlgB